MKSTLVLQTEVNKMLKYYNLEDKKQEIQELYDGYQFVTKDIYNPWSILNYVNGIKTNHGKLPKVYLINTSGNDIVKKLIKKTEDKARNEIELLIK